jgi:hypothetical protein
LDITENFGVDATQTAILEVYFTVIENISIVDVPAVQAAFQAVIAENINLLDNTEVAGWIKIIDDQTANWALINNPETAGWSLVNSAQTENWAVINNPETAGWTAVDTTESAGWTPIDNLQ